MPQVPLRHQNVENVKQFESVLQSVLRQKNMQYLETDTNFQLGFNYAWVFLQGTLGESAVNSAVIKKLESQLRQTQAENATLNEEIERLKKEILSAPLTSPVDNTTATDVSLDNTTATDEAPVNKPTVPKRPRPSRAKPKPASSKE